MVPVPLIITVPSGLSERSQPALACPPRVRALMAGNLIARTAVLPCLQALAKAVMPSDDFQLDSVGRTELDPDYADDATELGRA